MTTRVTKVHPLAELFPMLDGPELKALADDIKANGQLESIKITEDGMLVEGRNRLAACEMAKVEPRFETVNGEATNLILSANVFRRHMTKGQIAILAVVAEAGIDLPLGDTVGGVAQGQINYDYQQRAHSRVESLVSSQVIKEAARIIRWAPDHARIILDTGQGWREGREEADERSRAANSEETRRRVLAEDSPELLTQVTEDGITLAEAWRLRESRIRVEKETKHRLTGYLVDRVYPLLDKSNVEELVEHYDPEFAKHTIGIAELDEAIAYLRAIRSEMKRQQKG